MRFGELAEYLEKLEGTASRLEMTRILADLFSKTTPAEAKLVAYMTKGQLGPAYKSPDFGVADKQVIKAIKLLSDGDVEGVFKKTGDLGKTIEELKSRRKGEYKKLSIEDVYEKLSAIARAGGEGSQGEKIKQLGDLVIELDPRSAKYVVKMVLGKLRTGFSDMTVLDALSWMVTGDKSLRKEIESMYNVRADLGEIAEVVRAQGTRHRARKVRPEIGTPVLMARAERETSAEAIWERVKPVAGAEYKLDGLRIQAHITGSKVTLFSRGLENVTEMYPDVVGGLIGQIKKDCIVEGEMIAVGKGGRFLPFQETAQRKRKYDIAQMAEKIPLTIYLFDVLMVDGTDLTGGTYEERRGKLEELVGGGDLVRLMPKKSVKSASGIEDFFSEAVGEGCEGIIVKKMDGAYAAGARDFNWIKYKKSYDKSTLADTVDVVVMGYDAGQGKRSGFGIGGFLAGVYEPRLGKYLTVAKIGTGLTDEEWRELRHKCQISNVKSRPKNYEVTKQMGCDYWVEPSLVVEIKADEITKSPMHTSGYALRFPRFVAWREKKPEDATSAQEISKLYTLQEGRR